MNQALGNVGRTVVYTDPVNANPMDQTDSLRNLVQDMRSGKVDLLVILQRGADTTKRAAEPASTFARDV